MRHAKNQGSHEDTTGERDHPTVRSRLKRIGPAPTWSSSRFALSARLSAGELTALPASFVSRELALDLSFFFFFGGLASVATAGAGAAAALLDLSRIADTGAPPTTAVRPFPSYKQPLR